MLCIQWTPSWVDEITIAGITFSFPTVKASAAIHWRLRTRWFTIVSARIVLEGKFIMKTKMEAVASYFFDGEYPIPIGKLKTIVVPVFGVPVVITPFFDLKIGASIGITAKITQTCDQTYQMSGAWGIGYTKNSGWNEIGPEYNVITPSCGPLSFESECSAEAAMWANLKAGIVLYEVL